ncbi:MAG: hypothetical protein IPO87_18030 [Flavobacteriales bacterium]|nr:hypothetical protein [Flavobacteriales bacterium]
MNDTKFYDKIAFMEGKGLLDYVERSSDDPLQRNAGVLDIFQELMRPEDFKRYKPEIMKGTASKGKRAVEDGLEGYYKDWRTYRSATTNRCGCVCAPTIAPPIWKPCGRRAKMLEKHSSAIKRHLVHTGAHDRNCRDAEQAQLSANEGML